MCPGTQLVHHAPGNEATDPKAQVQWCVRGGYRGGVQVVPAAAVAEDGGGCTVVIYSLGFNTSRFSLLLSLVSPGL